MSESDSTDKLRILPLPGMIEPAAGVGVTFHRLEGQVPGTIRRVEPGRFWFQIDRGFEGADRLGHGSHEWTFEAVRQPDGIWREPENMRRVDVGVRRVCWWDPSASRPEVDQLAAEVERLEPWLLKRRWYPMTYMMIPSVLRSADELLARLAAHAGPETERVAALHERLRTLRAGFGRDA